MKGAHARMLTQINGVALHYEQSGSGDRHVLMLHGWGCSCSHFDPIIRSMQDDYSITAVDFPAHGSSGKPPEPWGVRDFAECIKQLIIQTGIAPCDIIAHSFGGRVALYLAAESPELVRRLVLTGCAGLKLPPDPVRQKRAKRYRMLKNIYQSIGKIKCLKPFADRGISVLRQKYGSSDYNALDDEMKKTFVRVISEDLSPLFPRIHASTLLIWGEKDTETPLWMGQKMEKEIPDAGLVVFEGDDHFAYLHQWARFVTVVRTFLT